MAKIFSKKIFGARSKRSWFLTNENKYSGSVIKHLIHRPLENLQTLVKKRNDCMKHKFDFTALDGKKK